jgi:hypothetical protein
MKLILKSTQLKIRGWLFQSPIELIHISLSLSQYNYINFDISNF